MTSVELKQVADYITGWVSTWFKDSNAKHAVIGLSGGIDSGVCAKLCADALGIDRVIGVYMPCGYQPDIQDAYDTAAAIGLTKTHEIDIGEANCILAKSIPGFANSEQAKLNLRPHIRMATLYGVAQSVDHDGNPIDGKVCCTLNRSKRLMGYTTLWGGLVGDFAPIIFMSATEVVAMGKYLGLPEQVLSKKSSDGLTGKTAEETLGVTYEDIDKYFRGKPLDKEITERIASMNKQTQYMRDMVRIPHP